MTAGGVPGDQHFDVVSPVKLGAGITKILRHAVENPAATGGRVLRGWGLLRGLDDMDWDLSWRRCWERDTILLRWHDETVEISGEMAKDIVRHETWSVSEYIANDLLRPPPA